MLKLWREWSRNSSGGVSSILVPPQAIYITIYLRVLLHELRPPPRQRDGNFRLSRNKWDPDWLEPEADDGTI